MPTSSPRSVRPEVSPAVLALLSAAAATAHEIVWGRLLGRAVGNTAWGVGLALALFMLGLGMGSLGARRLLARGWPAARTYAAAEIAIGLGAIAADAGLLGAGLPSRGIASASLGLATDLVWACGLVSVPALAIGAAYPLLVAASVRTADDAARVGALYRAGLAGGVVGVLGAGTVLAPRIGLDGAAGVAAATNLVVAALALRTLPARAPAGDTRGARPSDLREPTSLFLAAALFGLGAQVVWNRALLAYAGVSTLTFAAIVAVYLLAEAIGMTLGARRGAAWALVLAPAVAVLSLGPIGRLGATVPARDTSAGWLVSIGAVVAAAVAPTALLLGVAQARALRLIEESGAGWAERVAWVAGVGTAGSAVGSAVATLLFYPALGPRGTLVALGALSAALVARTGAIRPAAAGLAASFAALALAPGPRHFLGPEFDRARVLHVEHGVEDTVAVLRRDLPVEPRIRRLVSNGTSYSGDSLFAQRYMRLLAHLPALAARSERRALVLCIGTGSTAAALLPYRFRSVEAVDVSPTVLHTLRFFDDVNGGLRDPRLRILVEDGERLVRRDRRTWDVITLEPPPPRAPGASSLYARDFYESARARLAPGGVLAQWLPLHGMSGWEVRTLVRTFVEAFPRATLHLAERNEAILLGEGRREIADGARLSARVRADLAPIGLSRGDPLAETFVADGPLLRRLSSGAPVLRDAWPAPELVPLAGPRRPEPLDAWIESLARASPARGTFAATILPAVAPFVRIQEGRGRPGDRVAVAGALFALLGKDPENPYAQYMIGFGAYLRGRLRPEETAARAAIDRQRHFAAERLDAGP
jgi:spermidine synthase